MMKLTQQYDWLETWLSTLLRTRRYDDEIGYEGLILKVKVKGACINNGIYVDDDRVISTYDLGDLV